MDEPKKEDSLREPIGCILWIIALALIVFFTYHGAELADIVLDKLR